MDFIGKALKNVARLGAKTLRGGANLAQKAVDTAKRGVEFVENIPIVGDAVQLVPGYQVGKKALDLGQRVINVADRGAGVLESKTPSEALSRSLNLGREAAGISKRYKTTGGGTKFLKSELER